jgi:sarcosine oxidase subunit gamma
MAEHTATEERNTSGTAGLDELRVSPAAHLAEEMAQASVTGERGVQLEEIPFRPQIGVRAEPGTPGAEAVERALGVALPRSSGQSTGDAEGLHALWLSPDEFLVVDASRRQVPGEAAEAEQALEGLPGQVVDLSGNRTLLQLSGPMARDVLEKGCHVDVHPRQFPVGAVASTALGPVQVILHRSAEDSYRIYPRSSFAEYMARWLIDSMREYQQPEVE